MSHMFWTRILRNEDQQIDACLNLERVDAVAFYDLDGAPRAEVSVTGGAVRITDPEEIARLRVELTRLTLQTWS